MEDSLTILWDVVSALHDSGWAEDGLPQSIVRLWKIPIIEEKLTNLSSLSLPEEVVASDTIPVELTNMGACELISCSGMTDDGTTRYVCTLLETLKRSHRILFRLALCVVSLVMGCKFDAHTLLVMCTYRFQFTANAVYEQPR